MQLKRLADLPEWDPASTGAVPSGFPQLDDVLGGGFRNGEVSVWTGANSSGKSTLLGQILLEAVDAGQGCCAYSGELPGHIFRYWLELQAAGPQGLETTAGGTGTAICRPKVELTAAIREWYRDRLFLYDGQLEETGDPLAAFAQAADRHNCRVFLLDNLTMTVSRLHASDQYRAQRELILRAVQFARESQSHVHVVAHPRKTSAAELSKADIGGSGDITNLADNVLALSRNSGDRNKSRSRAVNSDARLKVLKNRFGGRQDEEIYLNFDLVSRRFYPVDEKPSDRRYGWERTGVNNIGWG